jgi:hypothetical protein
MNTQKVFNDNLRVGEDFEVRYAQPMLIQYYSDCWITPTHNFKISDGTAGGPRMHRAGHKSLILPDFLITRATTPTERVFVEAKWKKQPFSLVGGSRYFAIEDYKCRDYEEAAVIFGANLLYLIGCDEDRSLYMYNADDFIFHTFTNKFTKYRPVLNRCFEQNPSNIVGTF